jgi:hypothetical protein
MSTCNPIKLTFKNSIQNDMILVFFSLIFDLKQHFFNETTSIEVDSITVRSKPLTR